MILLGFAFVGIITVDDRIYRHPAALVYLKVIERHHMQDASGEYQKRLDTIMKAILASVDGLKGDPVYERIQLLQSLRGVGFMSSSYLASAYFSPKRAVERIVSTTVSFGAARRSSARG